jgi:hypothetical protein
MDQHDHTHHNTADHSPTASHILDHIIDLIPYGPFVFLRLDIPILCTEIELHCAFSPPPFILLHRMVTKSYFLEFSSRIELHDSSQCTNTYFERLTNYPTSYHRIFNQ